MSGQKTTLHMILPTNIELSNLAQPAQVTPEDVQLSEGRGGRNATGSTGMPGYDNAANAEAVARCNKEFRDLVAMGKHIQVEDILRRGKWSGSHQAPQPEVNSVDDFGETALHIAAIRGDILMADILIRHGASLTVRRYGNEFTPLDAAINAGRVDMVRFLLARGAPVNPVSIPPKGPLPLCVTMASAKPASEMKFPPVLPESGPKADGFRASVQAKVEEQLEKMRKDVEAGRSLNTRGPPLSERLAPQNMSTIFELLLQFGANPALESSVLAPGISACSTLSAENDAESDRRAHSLLLLAISSRHDALLDWCLDVAKVPATMEASSTEASKAKSQTVQPEGHETKEPRAQENKDGGAAEAQASIKQIARELSAAMQSHLLDPTSPADIIAGKLRRPAHLAAWHGNLYALDRLRVAETLEQENKSGSMFGVTAAHVAALADRPAAFAKVISQSPSIHASPDELAKMTPKAWLAWLRRVEPSLQLVPGGATLLHWVAAQSKSSPESVVTSRPPKTVSSFCWIDGEVKLNKPSLESEVCEEEETSVLMVILRRLDNLFFQYQHARRQASHDDFEESSTNPLLEITDQLGRTPLHWAVADSNIGSVYALVRFGASLNHADDEGTTPWQLAQSLAEGHLAPFLKWHVWALGQSDLRFKFLLAGDQTAHPPELAPSKSDFSQRLDTAIPSLAEIALPGDKISRPEFVQATSLDGAPRPGPPSLIRTDWDYFEMDAPLIGAFVRSARGVPEPDRNIVDKWQHARAKLQEDRAKAEEAKLGWTVRLARKLGLGVGLTETSYDDNEDDQALEAWLQPTRLNNEAYAPAVVVLLLLEDRRRLASWSKQRQSSQR